MPIGLFTNFFEKKRSMLTLINECDQITTGQSTLQYSSHETNVGHLVVDFGSEENKNQS